MKVLLISTVDLGGSRMDLFDRMLGSVVDFHKASPDTALTLSILFQNCSADRLSALLNEMPEFVEGSAVDRLVPLSVARNLMLQPRLAAGGLDASTLVAFPDDDAWYPANFLEGVLALFRDKTDLDFWFCRYGSSPHRADWNAGALVPAPRSAVVRKSSSNTMFFRGSVVAAIGKFDESLGLGTALGSAEDIDYALRAFGAARLSVLRDEILVGHRDKPPGLRGKYYAGSLVVLARHARGEGVAEFLRKLALGAYLVVRRELSLGKYVSALRAARAAFGHSTGHGKLAQGH
jgi:hypothetical protein